MKKNNKVYWTIRSGKKIDVDKMSLNHLRNALKMMIRNRDKEENHNYQCHCGAKFDGTECYACGFDATEIDIY